MAERSLSERVAAWLENGSKEQLIRTQEVIRVAMEQLKRDLTPDPDVMRQLMTI